MVIQTFNDIQCVYLFYFRHMSSLVKTPKKPGVAHDDLVPRSSPPTARWAVPPVSAMSASSVWPVATTFAAWIFRGVGGRRFLGPFMAMLVNYGTANSGSIEKQ